MPAFWDGFWPGLISGLISGLVANWAVLMIARLIAARFARYKVELRGLMIEKDRMRSKVFCPVLIKSSPLSRALVEPLREYIYAEVTLDGNQKIAGLWWPENNFRLLADGDMVALILVANRFSGIATLGTNDNMPIQEGEHTIQVQVFRSVDDRLAVEGIFMIARDAQDIAI